MAAMRMCSGCPQTWTGQSTCHCGGCHATFTSLSAFDSHQNSEGCHDPATMQRKSGKPVFAWNVNREMWSLWSDGESRWAS